MPKHQDKDIQNALEYAEGMGWRIVPSGGSSHAWGKLLCPFNDSACRCGEFCISSIWSTPKNPTNHARQIRRIVNRCIGRKEPQEDGR